MSGVAAVCQQMQSRGFSSGLIAGTCAVCHMLLLSASSAAATDVPRPVRDLIKDSCLDCHKGDTAEGGLDLTSIAFTLDAPEIRDRWIQIHDRIRAHEMPPDTTTLSDSRRQTLVDSTEDEILGYGPDGLPE